MNELVADDNIKIENYIYEARGQRVILDSDLAAFFQYETKQINRQVVRNIKRFPENYCFQLTEEEYRILRCQIGTSSNDNKYGGRRYLPYVFTEHGVTMLAGILKRIIDFMIDFLLLMEKIYITVGLHLKIWERSVLLLIR